MISLSPPAPKFETALNMPAVAKLGVVICDQVSHWSSRQLSRLTHQVKPTSTTCAVGDLSGTYRISALYRITYTERRTCTRQEL